MSAPRTVIFGCDHGAIDLKNTLRDYVSKKDGITVVDVGAHATDPVDYPDIATLVCKQVLSTPGSTGVVLCGSGIGISIACNKIKGIRCALCHDYYTAEMWYKFATHTATSMYSYPLAAARQVLKWPSRW